ncbi:B-box zinc finger protein [Syntrophothermus sp.]|uniref:B-box zinc finger protein n=1 Tax=Syntrophothermus sp. TaxID=2736299 RepID=UPI00338FEA41
MLPICDQHPQRQALRKCLMCGVLMCSECMAFGLQFGLIMCEDCVGRLLVLSWS